MSSFKRKVFCTLNILSPKLKTVLIMGNEKVESNAVEMANYLATNTKMKVYLYVSSSFEPYYHKLTDKGVNYFYKKLKLFYLLLTSKYVFSTHGKALEGSSKRQLQVNIWHGLIYKKIKKMRDEPGLEVDFTVGTSPLSQKQFSQAFGVPETSVLISGYPRNDMMLRAQQEKEDRKKKISPDFSRYDKVVFWMPTYRRKTKDIRGNYYEMKTDNPFQAENFDIAAFNEVLKAKNTLCLLKPHYFYMTQDNQSIEYSHIKMIDDEWIARQGITLYQLLACTDVLISDFSSVLIDYMLLDQPTVCFCTDLETYKKTQGLYFEDIEKWLPSELIQDQQTFFDFLEQLLTTGNDPYEEKRKKLRDIFFTYKDANSCQRLVEQIFDKKITV